MTAALVVEDIPSASLGKKAEPGRRPTLDALAEVVDAIPDPTARHAAYILLARLIEPGGAEQSELISPCRSGASSAP